MHIGILRTDSVRPEWVPTYGEYPDMFERLLMAEDGALTFTTWNVEAGELPDSVEAADGFFADAMRTGFFADAGALRAEGLGGAFSSGSRFAAFTGEPWSLNES